MGRRKTSLSRTIEQTKNKAEYDKEVKKILAHKIVLAWILVNTVPEFKYFKVREVVLWIEGEPEVGTTDVLTGMNVDSNEIDEGEVTYDVKFYALTPDGKRVKIIIDVEAQKDYYPGYDLVTRGVFYCARMLSSQLDVEFTTDNYDDIKKVYSIWICMNTPLYAQNTITKYSMTQNDIYGIFEKKARYDILSVIMIRLSDDINSGSELHKLLSLLLTDQLTPADKQRVLEEEYDIPISVELKEGLDNMCNLSSIIEEKGIEQGIERGIEQGRLDALKKMIEVEFTEEQILSCGYTKEDIEKVTKRE